MRYTPSGAAVASFSVATNRQYTASSGEQVKETIWFRISAWGRQAEVCNQYVKKGMKVLVEGRLTADQETGGPRVWGDPPKASFEVTAGTVRFLSSRGEYDQSSGSYGQQSDAGDMLPEEDDIPF
jgi:single-strand DNA-binding protein